MLPPERRLGEVLTLIEERKFFTLHAGRQTGKTTSLMWLETHLSQGGACRVIWVDLEMARETPDPAEAMGVILENITFAYARRYRDLEQPTKAEVDDYLKSPLTAVLRCLGRLSALDPRPLVALFDGADGLVGRTMVSFLTQIRQGYIERSRIPFPTSIALVGRRQVRGDVLAEGDRREERWFGTTSPFNITSEALTLAPFRQSEVGELLQQHTSATGQRFEPEAVERIAYLGQGHPGLTNALADQIVRRGVKDRRLAVTAEHVDAATEALVLARSSHADLLVSKLHEPRVVRVLAPTLVGDRLTGDQVEEDLDYVQGLGLIRQHEGRFQISNPIDREVVPRALTYVRQGQIPNDPAAYVCDNGTLNLPKLMADWQQFWRKDGHLAAQGFSYQEAGPHLMLMAFLQRIINGGGRIEREYGLGRGALDLVIFWKGEQHVIEVKLRRDESTEADAIEQIGGYLDHLGLNEGWLVLFDLRKTLTWAEKLTLRDVESGGKVIHIVGC